MTRTERNQYPAALLKDRHSRSGMHHDTELDRKHGHGSNNWGSLDQRYQHEQEAQKDAEADNETEEVGDLPKVQKPTGADIAVDSSNTNGNVGANGNSVEAVSPTDSMSSLNSQGSANPATIPKDIKSAPGLGGRRLSNVSDEERDKARVYREGVRASGGPINLTDIAKTSFGVSSPPNGNAFGTSPTKFKSGA